MPGGQLGHSQEVQEDGMAAPSSKAGRGKKSLGSGFVSKGERVEFADG